MNNDYLKPIVIDNVRVVYANLDHPDRLNPLTHNVTLLLDDANLQTMTTLAAGRKINGLKTNPDTNETTLKAKSGKAIKDGYSRFPRGYADGIDVGESIYGTDYVKVKLTPCQINGGPAANSMSFYLDAIKLEQVGTRDWQTQDAEEWGQDQASVEAIQTTDTPVQNVPAISDDDIPF